MTGPASPCRYSILTSLSNDNIVQVPSNLNLCLATGEADPVRGVAKATRDEVTGWVTKRCDVLIAVNGIDKLMFVGQDLQLVSGKFIFLNHSYNYHEKKKDLVLCTKC